MSMLARLLTIARRDAEVVCKKNMEYGESWCRRGGQQAFAVIWRKVDRIESILGRMNNGYDIFTAWEQNPGDIRDDIRDLRQYLMLLEEYLEREEIPPYADDPMPERKHVRDMGPVATFHTGMPQGQGYVNQD